MKILQNGRAAVGKTDRPEETGGRGGAQSGRDCRVWVRPRGTGSLEGVQRTPDSGNDEDTDSRSRAGRRRVVINRKQVGQAIPLPEAQDADRKRVAEDAG